jgi:hypothetical protein
VSRDGIHARDGIVGAHADPVGDGAVLALLLRQLLLDPGGLVRRLREEGDGTRKKSIGSATNYKRRAWIRVREQRGLMHLP